MKAYRHLIKHALDNGHVVSVFDGEEWQVEKSAKMAECCEAVESVDESSIRIFDAAGEYLGTAFVVLEYDQAPEESVYDYTISPFMDGWNDNYSATY